MLGVVKKLEIQESAKWEIGSKTTFCHFCWVHFEISWIAKWEMMKLKLFCNSCWVNLVINWACKVRDWKMFLCHFCQVDLQTSQTRNASSFKFEGVLWLFIKTFCCRRPKVKDKHIHNYCWVVLPQKVNHSFRSCNFLSFLKEMVGWFKVQMHELQLHFSLYCSMVECWLSSTF
jgi:hypothetical protein